MSTMGAISDWSAEFEGPIRLPKGSPILTLMDAGDYISKLPEAEHTEPEWRAAMEALILVVRLAGGRFCADRHYEGLDLSGRARVQS